MHSASARSSDAPHFGEVAKVAELLGQVQLLEVSLAVLESAAISNALRNHRGNRTHAARSLGISVRTLQRKLKSWPALQLDGNGRSEPPELLDGLAGLQS